MTPEKRILLALQVMQKVRDQIGKSGIYSPAMMPNLRSVEDTLTIPDDILEENFSHHPEYVVTDFDCQKLRNSWKQ